MESLTVRDAVPEGRQAQTIPENMPFEQILQHMLGSSQQDFPVVDNDEKLKGIISLTDLREAMADKELHRLLLARDVAIEGVVTVTMDDTLNEALRIMAALDVRELPVVNGKDQRNVVSIVSRKDITRAYHVEMERARKPSSGRS